MSAEPVNNLTWTERTIVDELAGALTSVASYIKHRPSLGSRLRQAVLADLGNDERELLDQLSRETTA